MFRKWTSIENSHNRKYIQKAISYVPELIKPTCIYVITEKIDGANFSVIFTPQGEIQFARRTDFLKTGETFYNYQEVFKCKMWNSFKEEATEHAIKNNVTIQFVGELFGKGVQGRVYYGDGRYWKWFAIYETNSDGEMRIYDYNEMNYDIADIPHAESFRIKTLAHIKGLNSALNFGINRDSIYTPEGYDKPNFMEGIVIRPYFNYYVNRSLFIIKLKNEKFRDLNVPKEKKELHVSEQLQTLYDKVAGMVNENRLADLFSKYGMIEEMNQIGKYLGYYAKDVVDDMIKYYGDEYNALESDAERKWVKKQITTLIREELLDVFRNG